MQLELNKKDFEKYQTPKEILESTTKKSYTRGDIIYNRGDVTKILGQIKSGLVGLVNLSTGGHEALLRVLAKTTFWDIAHFWLKKAFMPRPLHSVM